MSGTNPFRRNRGPAAQSSTTNSGAVNSLSNRPEARISPIDTDLPRPTKTKTSKTVRIISPHSAASDREDDFPQRTFHSPSHTLISSPPPPHGLLESPGTELSEDPFGADSDQGGGSAEDENTNQTMLDEIHPLSSSKSGYNSTPANPFKKMPANAGAEAVLGPTGQPVPPATVSKIARQHYDVDDFKRLLLTGEKPASGPNALNVPTVSFQGQHSTGDTSSNTDASSISRQSIFEPVSGPILESPRTSHEGSPSDDEGQEIVGSPPSTSTASKPFTPKHRHGKQVEPNAPQTVSFEDPSLSLSGSTVSPSLASDQLSQAIPASTGAMNKPLPSLPQSFNAGEFTDITNTIGSTAKSEAQLDSPETQASRTAQKREPPPPPLSRRHSQLRSKPFMNPTRSTTISEEDPTEQAPSSISPLTSQSKQPPPPPPPRRSGLVRINSSSSIATSSSFEPSQSHIAVSDTNETPSKPRPPAPPNRSPTLPAVKRQQTQSLAGSPSMAPPPPPRRRGSSQSSYTPSRLSGDYRSTTERLRSDSGASSVSQFQMTSLTPSSTDSQDVLADLSTLQREVDELRGKFRE